jgi:hypothetical protein
MAAPIRFLGELWGHIRIGRWSATRCMGLVHASPLRFRKRNWSDLWGPSKSRPRPCEPLKNSRKKFRKKIPEKFVIKKESRLLPSPHAADPFLRFFGASPISGSVTQHMPREEQEDAHPCEHSRPPLGDAIVGATDYGSGLGTIWARLVAALVQELI